MQGINKTYKRSLVAASLATALGAAPVAMANTGPLPTAAQQISNDGGATPDNLVYLAGKIYFKANGDDSGNQLWSMNADGTEPKRITDINAPDFFPRDLVAYNGKLYFSGNTTGDLNSPLYEMFELNPVTDEIVNLDINSTHADNMSDPYVHNGKLYFSAGEGEYENNRIDGEIHDTKLWVKDGDAPAQILAELNLGEDGAKPTNFVSYKNKLYFTAYSNNYGSELWVYDDSQAVIDGENPKMVYDLPGTINTHKGTFGVGMTPSYLTEYNGMLYLTADRGDEAGVSLYRTDGESEPEFVHTVAPSGTTDVRFLTSFNGKLYMTAGTEEKDGTRLYVYNSLKDADGAVLLTEDMPEADELKDPFDLTVYHNRMYFSAVVDGDKALYVMDSESAPKKLMTINDEGSDSVSELVVQGGVLYFVADNGDDGKELYLIDEFIDSDNDNVRDELDAYPNDPNRWVDDSNAGDVDSDGDGVIDSLDRFPNDITEWEDSDNDGLGDNSDPNKYQADDFDSDGDGVLDIQDHFPFDPAESEDSDGDGTGDNADKFPNDAAASIDTDNDGYPDAVVEGVATDLQIDVFPDDAAAALDSDDDGYPDFVVDGVTTELVVDHFPEDAAAHLDSDNDGQPDSIVAGSVTDLIVDGYPTDPLNNDVDGDGVLNDTDTDIDGDGYSNTLEVEYNSDPNSASFTPSYKAILHDLREGSGSSSPKYFTEFNGKTYFQASTGDGYELHVYDPAVTDENNQVKQVTDILEGTGSSSPIEFVVAGDALYFVANDGTGKALWVLSNADAAVPTKVAEFATTADDESTLDTDETVVPFTTIEHLYVMGDKIYFAGERAGDTKSISTYSLANTAYDEEVAAAVELYSFDTVSKEIELVLSGPAEGGLAPENFTEVDGTLYFTGVGHVSVEPGVDWFGNPIESVVETVSLHKLTDSGAEIIPGVESIYQMHAHDGKLFMNAAVELDAGEVDTIGQELAIYDPSTGSVEVFDTMPGVSQIGRPNGVAPESFVSFKGDLYFSDGTQLVKYVGGDDVIEYIYKANYDEITNSNLNPKYLTVLGDNLYFQGLHGSNSDEGQYGKELFVYDGVNAPDIALDLRAGGSSRGTAYSGRPQYIAAANGELFFYATNGTNGNDLYVLTNEMATADVDSDLDGVFDLVDDFPTDAAASVDTDDDGYPDALVDGIATDLVVDVFPTDETEWADSDLDGVGDNTDAFDSDIAASVDDDMDGLPDAWNAGKTAADSTSSLVLDPSLNDSTNDLDGDGIRDDLDTDIDGDGYSNTLEVKYNSDPNSASFTPSYKAVLHDLREGSGSSSPKYFTEFNGKTYFQASTGDGYELHVYDPAVADEKNQVKQVTDILEGTGSSSPIEFVVAGDALYFVANDGTDKALWVLSNADAAVPTKVAQFATTADDESTLDTDETVVPFTTIEHLYVMGDKIYFAGERAGDKKNIATYTLDNNEYGEEVDADLELYSFDTQTKAITLEVAGIAEGGLEPDNLVELDGALYFSGYGKVYYGWGLSKFGEMAQQVNEIVMLHKLTEDGVEVISGAQNITAIHAHDGKLFMNATAELDEGEIDTIGKELVIYDPNAESEAEAMMVLDALTGTDSSGRPSNVNPTEFVSFKGDVYFESNRQLAKYVGGDDVIEYIYKATYDELTNINLNPEYLTVLGDNLYFQGLHGSDSTIGLHGTELFVYDGVNAPDIALDLRAGASSRGTAYSGKPQYIAAANGELFFYANNGTNGNDLHVLTNEMATADVDNDSDKDGVADIYDAFPTDAAASVDTDDDGYPDALVAGANTTEEGAIKTDLVVDAFPNDETEWMDSDLDGVGDNADLAPNDASINLDSDGDGVADALDAFPNDAAASVDLDLDGAPDAWNAGKTAADSTQDLQLDQFINNGAEWSDIDRDGVGDNSDAFPSNASASVDANGDGYPDFYHTDFNQEIAAGYENLKAAKAKIDTIIEGLGGFVSMTATGVDTSISTLINELVSSAQLSGVVLKSIVDGETRTSGEHEVAIELLNAKGFVYEMTVPVAITPLAIAANNAYSLVDQGFEVQVTLTGTPIEYPVTFDYQLLQISTLLLEGVLTFEDGEMSKSLTFDGMDEGEYKLTIEAENDNAVFKTGKHLTTVHVQENTAPIVSAALLSDGKKVTTIATDDTATSLVLNVADADGVTEHNMTVTINGVEVMNDLAQASNVISLVPSDIGAGELLIDVTVTETNQTPAFTVSNTFEYYIASALPELSYFIDSDNDGISDADEGFSDSDGDGIADYLDNANLKVNQQQAGNTVLSVEEGLTLRAGNTAVAAGKGMANGIGLTIAQVAEALGVEINDADVQEYLTPIMDFTIDGATVGQTVNLVLPLSAPLPANAEYRKIGADGQFRDFAVKDDQVNFTGDQIWSAMRDSSGQCPAVSSTDWQIGLVEGNDCIKLQIVDGGANDDDGKANGVIVDPGVLVAVNAPASVSLDNNRIVEENSMVTLVATVSDPEGDAVTYNWTQFSGDTLTLSGTDTNTLSFNAPSVTADTVFEFRLVVNDGKGNDSTRFVTVTVTENGNTAPSVTASASLAELEVGQSATLTATATDVENDELTYSWVQTSGVNVVLANTNTAQAAFTAPEVSETSTVVFQVTVSDGEYSTTADVSVSIKPTPKEDSGSSAGFWMLTALAGLVGLRRRRK